MYHAYFDFKNTLQEYLVNTHRLFQLCMTCKHEPLPNKLSILTHSNQPTQINNYKQATKNQASQTNHYKQSTIKQAKSTIIINFSTIQELNYD